MAESHLKPPILAEPAFVGREAEFLQLERLLDSVCSGRGATVFVFGEAGSGKTRFVKEFLKTARRKAVTVMTGFCISKTATPYFPFIEAFNMLQSSGHVQRAEKSVKDPGIVGWLKGDQVVEVESIGIAGWLKGSQHGKPGKQPMLSAEIRKDMTYAAVLNALLSISVEKPLVLFLEDVHWADSASLALLHYVSRGISSSKVFVIATVRLEEMSQDSEGRPNPLAETLQLMRREDLYVEVRIPNLQKPEVVRLAELMVNGPIDPAFVERLSRDSQGNPLFAVESVRMLIESGSLLCKDGTWCLTAKELDIPTKVKDVILYRLNRLNAVQRRILDLGSTIGERFDPALVGAVFSQDVLTVLETLNVIARSTLLIHPIEDVYKFGHGKFREVLYDEMSSPLRREYHERIAEKLEGFAKEASELPVNDLAFHYVQAGNKEKAVRYSIAAGEDALKRFSNTEAVKHFDYVLKTVSEDPRYAAERLVASEGLGDAFAAMGGFEEAANTFDRLSKISESGGTRLRALRKAMTASFNRGDFPRALGLADRAEKDSGIDRLEYARVQMCRAKTNSFRGNLPFSGALKELEGCLQIFEEGNSTPDVADALLELGALYVTDGQGQEAARLLRRAVELYEKMGNSRRQAETYFWLGNAQFTHGSNNEALESFAKVVKVGEKIGEYNRMAWARLYSGLLHESLWEVAEMLDDSLEGLEYAEKTDSYYIQSAIYANLARGYAKLGDSKRVEEFREKFFKSIADSSRMSSKLIKAVGVRTEAVLFAANGQWTEANVHFEECLELMKGAMGSMLHQAMARTDYAWALRKQEKFAEARTQIEEARKLYRKLGNESNIERLDVILR